MPAYAIAKSGSSSTARWKNGRAAESPFPTMRLLSLAVGLQRIQRWRSRFFQWCPVFLHRAERFSQFASYADCRGVQSLEYRFLGRRRFLRFRQHVSRGAVDCLQANHVWLPSGAIAR